MMVLIYLPDKVSESSMYILILNQHYNYLNQTYIYVRMIAVNGFVCAMRKGKNLWRECISLYPD